MPTSHIITMTDTKENSKSNFNVDLTNVQYQDAFKLRSGSMAQLVLGVKSMLNRVAEDKESDSYKKELYPPLRQLATQLVDKFCLMLNAENQKEHDVRQFNLCGYNGQVKPDRYGHYPYVGGVNPNTKYAFANFGYFVKMLKQRAEYLMSSNVPQRYVSEKEQGDVFTLLRGQVGEFHKFLTDCVEVQWNEIVKKARVSGGETVQQQLEKRQKAQEERKARGEFHKTDIPVNHTRNAEEGNHRRSGSTLGGDSGENSRGGGGRGGFARGRGRGGSSRGRTSYGERRMGDDGGGEVVGAAPRNYPLPTWVKGNVVKQDM